MLEYLDYDHRYRTAHQMIQASLDTFGYLEALEVLQEVKQTITKFSFVVVPSEEQIYLALFGNFSRIWQVDFAAETIATYQGFDEYRVEPLNEHGFTPQQLLEWK